MASGDVLVDILPPTPTPSTSDISILAQQQQQQPQPIQGVQEAFRIPDVLYTVVFSILWLFGLARNLATYVVSLGIIPLKTATQLFGIKPVPQTQLHPILAERDRKPGSRHTRVDKSSALTNPRSRHGWNTHTSGKASSSSTSSTGSAITRTTGSAPGTPRKHHRTSLPAEALTDSEGILHRPRNPNRHTAPATSRPSRLVNFREGVSEEGELVEGEMVEGNGGDAGEKRARSRSRVDHSTRRILFVDPKNARRQTAPPVPYPSQSQPPLVSGVEVGERMELTESPLLDTVGLPSVRSVDSQPHSSLSSNGNTRPKSTPQEEPASRPTTNEFGEFVSAPIPSVAPNNTTTSQSQSHSSSTAHGTSNSSRFPGETDRDAAAASGTESVSERRSRGKERFRSGFRLFGKKRSSSVASTGEGGTAPESTPSNSNPGHSNPGPNKLRRKSPYPGRFDSHGRSSTEALHKHHLSGTALVAGAGVGVVSVSDAEACSTTWLRSRPKKLTRRARSNSLSEGVRVQPPSIPPPTTPSTSASPQPSSQIPTDISIPASSSPPLNRSSTMASTSTSASGSSNNPTTTTSKRISSGLSFNPLRDLEARLYYRHGVGTGPSTADVSSYVTTPVPKTGIKRTNPYVLLGVEPPRGSPNASAVQLGGTGSRLASSSSSSRPNSSGAVVPTGPSRRVSAPSGEENVGPLKRPNTPSRAHTQPL